MSERAVNRTVGAVNPEITDQPTDQHGGLRFAAQHVALGRLFDSRTVEGFTMAAPQYASID